MADVLLVYPKAGHDIRGVSVNAPLALLTLAAPLVKDFSVQIIDQRACDDFWGDLEKALLTKPKVVGITSMTGTQVYHGLEASRFIKERMPEVPTVWGGMHPTICAAQTASKSYIDFVMRGEGDLAFRKFVEMQFKEVKDYTQVPGLVWKRDGKIVQTPQADPIELNDLPKIPWDLVNIEEYTSPTQFLYRGIKRLLPYQGSRGCPFKCTYCSEPVLTKKYRMMKPEKIAEECFEIVDKYKLDHISFFDEEFFVNRRWATAVADAIGGKFTWWAQTRAADLLHVDLKRMEKNGLHVLAPGLESGSDRILKFVKKGETIEEYIKANKALTETNILVQYNFIVGFPTETREEIFETVDLVLKLLDENPNALVNSLSPLTPLPGTQLLKQAVADFGFMEPRRLEDWIQVTRGKQERPWLDKRQLSLVRFLYYTSYFLCSAERYSQKFKIPKWILRLYSKSVSFRWKHKLMWLNWEIPVLRLIFKHFINPLDYMLSDTYGDKDYVLEQDIVTLPRVQPEKSAPTSTQAS